VYTDCIGCETVSVYQTTGRRGLTYRPGRGRRRRCTAARCRARRSRRILGTRGAGPVRRRRGDHSATLLRRLARPPSVPVTWLPVSARRGQVHGPQAGTSPSGRRRVWAAKPPGRGVSASSARRTARSHARLRWRATPAGSPDRRATASTHSARRWGVQRRPETVVNTAARAGR
jgi:hypothetical protein